MYSTPVVTGFSDRLRKPTGFDTQMIITSNKKISKALGIELIKENGGIPAGAEVAVASRDRKSVV